MDWLYFENSCYGMRKRIDFSENKSQSEKSRKTILVFYYENHFKYNKHAPAVDCLFQFQSIQVSLFGLILGAMKALFLGLFSD